MVSLSMPKLPLSKNPQKSTCVGLKSLDRAILVRPRQLQLKKFSRDEKIRTSDLQHPMLARYLATLHPG